MQKSSSTVNVKQSNCSHKVLKILRHHPQGRNPLVSLQEGSEGWRLLLSTFYTLKDDVVIVDIISVQLQVGTESYKNIS